MHISSSYAKILGETNFHTREIPRSGSKAKDGEKKKRNTPGTAGGPGGRDRTLAVKSRKNRRKSVFFRTKIKITPKKYFFLHISSTYAKILGETNFGTQEIPRSGSKAEDGGKKRGEKEERK